MDWTRSQLKTRDTRKRVDAQGVRRLHLRRVGRICTNLFVHAHRGLVMFCPMSNSFPFLPYPSMNHGPFFCPFFFFNPRGRLHILFDDKMERGRSFFVCFFRVYKNAVQVCFSFPFRRTRPLSLFSCLCNPTRAIF